MQKYQKPIIVLILIFIFTTWFLHNTKRDFPLIFQKDLLAHDESSNSVVATNLTRKFFPTMIRVNPLNEQQGIWMEGPFWQHIPPLFAYVPYIFFKLDGQISIEVKRLSYAFVTLLTGLLFIFGVYKFRRSILSAIAATIAAILWINTSFTHELITGYAFGVSDIVLAFTVVVGFCAVLWYLRKEKQDRINYPTWQLILVGLIVALPIMAKNLLGAIPAATYFILVLRDFRGISKKFLMAAGSFIIILLVYYVPLYFASPQTFKTEILVGFFHFKNLEGWERPWYFYITNYLPQRYLGNWTWVFYALLILGIMYRVKGRGERKDKILLNLSLGWFLWNLIAISLVTSKVPNFIYQSYLLSLFFVVYAVVTFVSSHFDRLARSLFLKGVSLASSSTSRSGRFVRDGAVVLLVISFTITGYEGYMFAQQFKIVRAAPYNYQTEHEKFYQTAEEFRGMGLDTKDLIIVRVSDNDCWFRYYPLFLTGTESKTLLEMYFGFDPNAIKQKYNQMYFVMNKTDQLNEGKVLELTNYKIEQFDITKMTVDQINSAVANFIADHKQDIPQDILRIKKDKTSCQWLVPDPILNAP